MLVVGLTGSIGMGKSAAAAHLRRRGIPVFDADGEVHRLYEGEAAGLIEQAFPGSTINGRVDRFRLAEILGGDPRKFRTIEGIVHPLVQRSEREFLREAAGSGTSLAVLEIPLLFETGADRKTDVTIVVSAPSEVQRRRVLERPGMTDAKLDHLLARQLDDAEKRRRATFVVDTSGTLARTEQQIDDILAAIRGREGHAYREHWA